MNILQVTHSFLPPSGFEYVVHNLSTSLSKKGHTVTVFAFYPRKKSEKSILDYEKCEYSIFRYYLPRTHGLFHKTIFSYYINKVLAMQHYDIMHVHMAYPTCYFVAKTVKKNIPYVLTPHGSDIQIDRDSNYGVRLDKNIDLKVREILKKVEAITAISTSMKNEIVDLGADPQKIILVPNGIDLTEYKDYKTLTDLNKPFIFSMGRLVKKKGFHILINIYAEYIKLGGQFDLIIAGDGPEKTNIHNTITQLKLSDKVFLVGYLQHEKKLEMLAKSYYFVCPSIKEPFGIVNVEAMALGKPIISFKIDGLTDIIENNINGFLIKPFDLNQFAQKMISLEKNQSLRHNMSKSAIMKASKYDWDFISDMYLVTYQNVIKRNKFKNI